MSCTDWGTSSCMLEWKQRVSELGTSIAYISPSLLYTLTPHLISEVYLGLLVSSGQTPHRFDWRSTVTNNHKHGGYSLWAYDSRGESLHTHTISIARSYCTVGNFSREKTLTNFKVLNVAIYFSPIRKKFSRLKVSRYTVAHVTWTSQYGNLFLALATRNWYIKISMPT